MTKPRSGNGRFAKSVETAERRAKAVELRAQGLTYRAISEQLGWASPSVAQAAITQAIKDVELPSVEELIKSETARLEFCDQRLSEIIANPPIKTTSIGRTQWDVRTCHCPVKARTDRDHDPDCPVQPILDESIVVAAIGKRLAIGESVRKMRGADSPAQMPVRKWESDPDWVAHVEFVQALQEENRGLRAALAEYGSIQPPRAITAPANGHPHAY